MIDENEVIKDQYAYGPYHELLNHTGSSEVMFQYVGKYGVVTDTNTLLFMMTRYYSTDIKRFISQDIINGSIGSQLSTNQFIYSKNNPLNYYDPQGLEPITIWDGDNTPITLNKRTGSKSKTTSSSSVQQNLVIIGFNIGTSGPNGDGVDGVFGEKSNNALNIFRAWAGIGKRTGYDDITNYFLNEAVESGITYRSIVKELLSDLKLQVPVDNYTFTSGFVYREVPTKPGSGIMEKHMGIDLAANEGTEISAAIGGTVVYVGNAKTGGEAVIIKSVLDSGIAVRTVYYHMIRGSYGELTIGSIVSQGQKVGEVGMTGVTTGPHLHFEFQVMNGNISIWINPEGYQEIE